MAFTPDSVLALLALIVMLAPAARCIYRLVQRRRRPRPSTDIEAVRMFARTEAPRSINT
jgi:hypothetical protein